MRLLCTGEFSKCFSTAMVCFEFPSNLEEQAGRYHLNLVSNEAKPLRSEQTCPPSAKQQSRFRRQSFESQDC